MRGEIKGEEKDHGEVDPYGVAGITFSCRGKGGYCHPLGVDAIPKRLRPICAIYVLRLSCISSTGGCDGRGYCGDPSEEKNPLCDGDRVPCCLNLFGLQEFCCSLLLISIACSLELPSLPRQSA